MIRYAISEKDLLSEIDKEAPTWRSNAKRRQSKINKAKKYDEKTNIWGEIKNVYRRLQNHKCAFCERQLAGEPHGAIEHDIEHFRPKNATKSWSHDSIDTTWHQRGRADGYYWLAYDLFNYAASCKTCNTPLKGNAFPVVTNAGNENASIEELNKSEQPLLIYPISDRDTDPETLIHFDGVGAVAVHNDAQSPEHRRAMVTIAFFDLNGRPELLRERARVIKNVWDALEKRDATHATREQIDIAREDLAIYVRAGHDHANCARSFLRLYGTDPARAWEVYKAARKIYDDLVRGGRP